MQRIYMYLTPTLFTTHVQVLWLLGVLGALYVASQQPELPLPLVVAQQPWSIWFVGPAAAAVTGRQAGTDCCWLGWDPQAIAVCPRTSCRQEVGWRC